MLLTAAGLTIPTSPALAAGEQVNIFLTTGIPQYGTEMSGGTWVGNQHTDDMNYIINTTRNWARTVTKWSLAIDQNHNPHNGGCGTCNGLITVHNGDGQHGQVTYTTEYYTLSSLSDAARLVQTGGVDLLRVHVSTVGGLSACRKLVALCEFNGVRTAWHGPGDVSPVGVAANIALDVTTSAFGIQEGHVYNDATLEVFPGTPVAVDGYLYPSDAPGWGVDLDEKLAAKFVPETGLHERWAGRVRRPDGGLESP